MKTVSKHFRIVTYGDAFSHLWRSDLRQAARGLSVVKSWTPASAGARDTGEFLLVSSDELDDAFVEAFREYATRTTRLLVFRQEGVSADRLLSRIIDLQIRTPQRFYVLDSAVGSGKAHRATFIFSLLKRLAAAVEADDQQERILNATVEDAILHVASADLNRLDVPIAKIPFLKNAQASRIQHFEIDEDGAFIYWPGLDVHLGWTQLQQLVNPQVALKARQRSEDFNKRYGKAVQKVRESAGLKPADVQELSEKQLGRIEKGQCRLTSNAVEALSKAHRLDPNEYLKKLADALEWRT